MVQLRRVFAVVSALMLIVLLAVPAGAAGRPEEGEDICISRSGVNIRQEGSAECDSDGTSYAIARGANSDAYAYDGSRAEANGDGAYAYADERSRATATGTDAYAEALDSSTAVAQGFSAYAFANNFSSANARGEDSDAEALGYCKITARAFQFQSCGDFDDD